MIRGAGFGVLILTGLFLTLAAEAGDRAKGEALAIKLCARCHVISEKNPFGGIGSSPSFPAMAKYADMFRPRIRSFQERRPHAQFRWDVDDRDIEDLVTYIMSLPVK